MAKVLTVINKIEPFFFYGFVLFYTIPVFSNIYFLTVDGPAHLYNSNIIVELLIRNNRTLSEFFMFNDTITPNWAGHFLLSILLIFLPGAIAEKIVILLYVMGLPLSIRYVFNKFKINDRFLLYLVFPFVYSYLFYYGFYNFLIGQVLFFIGIGMWIDFRDRQSLSGFIKLLLISTLICFSHLFVFGLFVGVIVLLNSSEVLTFFTSSKAGRSRLTKYFLRQAGSLLPGLFILVLFVISDKPSAAQSKFIPAKDLVISLKTIMAAKGINYENYYPMTELIRTIFIGLIAWVVIKKVYDLLKTGRVALTRKKLFIIVLSLLVLIFTSPDYVGISTGFISSRLMHFFFLFLIVWLSTQATPLWIKSLIFCLILFINVQILRHNYGAQKGSRVMLEELADIAGNMESNSVILPITFSGHFLHSHVSNYVGVDKPQVILENYEATLSHFPLKWDYENLPVLKIGEKKMSECFPWTTDVADTTQAKSIDYVLILNYAKEPVDDVCFSSILKNLKYHYRLVYSGSSNKIHLYEAKLRKGPN